MFPRVVQDFNVLHPILKNYMESENNMKEQHADVELDLDLQPVETERYDSSVHAGKKVKIERATTHMTDRFKNKSYYLKVVTEVLDTLDNENKTEIRASRIFGLHQDNEGSIGWSQGSKLDNFLKSMKVSNPKELVGKEVLVSLTDADENGVRYCTF